MTGEMSDHGLAERIINKEPHAWERFVERYMPMVFSLVLHHVKNFHDAQDIAQETFLQAYIRLPQLREPSKLIPWLRRIALNLCHTWHRRRKVERASLETLETQVRPDEELGRIELCEAIGRGLSEFSERLYSVFVLYHLDGLSYREITACLELPEGTVKRRLHDARKAFMEEIATMFEEEKRDSLPVCPEIPLIISEA